jgi:hypothetical protein
MRWYHSVSCNTVCSAMVVYLVGPRAAQRVTQLKTPHSTQLGCTAILHWQTQAVSAVVHCEITGPCGGLSCAGCRAAVQQHAA